MLQTFILQKLVLCATFELHTITALSPVQSISLNLIKTWSQNFSSYQKRACI